MRDAWVDRLIRDEPVQKLPTNTGQIRAWLDGRHQALGPRASRGHWQALEDAIFQTGEHHGDTEPRLVLHVIARMERAADRATLPIGPVPVSLNQLVRRAVARELRELREDV